MAAIVGVVPALGRIQRIGGGTGGAGDLDAAAALALPCSRSRGSGSEGLARRAEQATCACDRHTRQPQHAQRIAARHAAIEPFENTLALLTANQLGFGFIFVVCHIVLPVDNEKARMSAIKRSDLVTQTTVNQQSN
ncbi:hypothetical protein D9M70_468950 [compost metagenome]